MSERRQAPRTAIVDGVVVRVRFKTKRQLEQCYVKDLSHGGIFLRTPTPLAPFERVNVVLELPDGDAVEVSGNVVHVVSADEAAAQGRAAGMGVQFGDLTGEKRAKLERFLEVYKSGPILPTPPPAVDEVARTLRRLALLAVDPQAILDGDHYQLLGVSHDADATLVRERCGVLRALLDPAGAPEGLEPDRDRALAAVKALDAVEETLCDPTRRAEYDAMRLGILR